MRLMLGFTVLAAVAVTGCKSQESQMAEARKEIGDMCRESPPPMVNADQYCNCVVEKSIGNKTAGQLRKMTEKEGEQLGRQVGAECMAQVGVTPAPGTPEETEQVVTEKAAKPVEEAVDEVN